MTINFDQLRADLQPISDLGEEMSLPKVNADGTMALDGSSVAHNHMHLSQGIGQAALILKETNVLLSLFVDVRIPVQSVLVRDDSSIYLTQPVQREQIPFISEDLLSHLGSIENVPAAIASISREVANCRQFLRNVRKACQDTEVRHPTGAPLKWPTVGELSIHIEDLLDYCLEGVGLSDNEVENKFIDRFFGLVTTQV